MRYCVVFLIWISLFGCDTGPTCEAQGGEYQFSYYVMYPIGQPGQTMLLPIYECKFPQGVKK